MRAPRKREVRLHDRPCLLMSKLTAEARPCNEEPRPPLKSARGRLDGSDGLPVADRGDKTKEEAEDATPYRHGFHFADFKTRFKTITS